MDMTYRPLGSSGLMVSAVGIGCNAFSSRVDQDGVAEILDMAQETGVTLLDTADIYGVHPGASEELLGHALKGRRDDFVLATKFGMDMKGTNGADHGVRGSRRYIRRAVEASLRRLQTDHIDLYQLHAPDEVTPIEETLGALTEIVREGKVRYIGSSNFAGWQVVDADWTARTGGYEGFISGQNEYSWLDRSAESELVPALDHTGQSLLPYFPLARGLLTGKYRRGEAPPGGSRLAKQEDFLANANFDVIEGIGKFAEDRGISMLEVAIGGLAAMPTVGSVIAGATSAEQVAQNVAAGLWTPAGSDLEELRSLTA
jgi:aryl-alcohol dehydrogenase-like predicted oxidoreductase